MMKEKEPNEEKSTKAEKELEPGHSTSKQLQDESQKTNQPKKKARTDDSPVKKPNASKSSKWTHHIGKIKMEYINDTTERRKSRSHRRRTLCAKGHELVTRCGGEVFIQYTDENNKTWSYCSSDEMWQSYRMQGLKPRLGRRLDSTGRLVADTQVLVSENHLNDSVAVLAETLACELDAPDTANATTTAETSSDQIHQANGDNNEETTCGICAGIYVKKRDNKRYGRWVGCENFMTCGTWVHRICIGWTESDVDTLKYYCSVCQNDDVISDLYS